MKAFVSWMLGLVVSSTLSHAVASPAGIEDGLRWLQSVQQPGAGWGDPSSPLSVRETAEVLRAFAALGQANASGLADARVWLRSLAITDLDSMARRLSALSGQAYPLTSDISTLFQLGAQGNPLPLYLEDGGEDFWVEALSFKALNEAARTELLTSNDIGSRVGRVLYTHQGCLLWNGDACASSGGWGIERAESPRTEPEVVTTALVLLAFSDPYYQTIVTDLATKRQAALEFLLSSFHADGGAGAETSSVLETAYALLALEAIGYQDLSVISNACAYLRAHQSANGSWSDSPFLSALVLQVLDTERPDLVVSSDLIAILPDYPVTGEPLDIAMSVKNQGAGAAAGFAVELFDGNPTAGGTLVGTSAVSGLLPGENRQITIHWAAAPAAGIHDLYVIADRANTLDDPSKADNIGAKSIRIAPLRDLSLFAEHVSFVPANPTAGQEVRIHLLIGNTGGIGLDHVAIRFFDGNPASGGMSIGSDEIIQALDRNQDLWVEHSLGVLPDGTHTIYAVVDPENQISEADENNNQVSKTLTIGRQVDLVALAESVELSNNEPYDGDDLSIRARIWNSREQEANNVIVRIFEGHPNQGGVQLGQDMFISSIAGFGTAATNWLNYPTLHNSGTHLIYVQIDPLNEISETIEDNNLASRPVVIGARTDLALMAVRTAPSQIEEEDPAQIIATVANLGSAETYANWEVRWYDGDPKQGGRVFARDQYYRWLPKFLSPGDSVDISATIHTKNRPSDRPIFVEVGYETPQQTSVTQNGENANKEITLLNNQLSMVLPMIPAKPDLAVSSFDIHFNPPNPVEGDTVQISVDVHNLSKTACPAASIQLYKGPFDWRTTSNVVATGIVPSLGPRESTTVILEWNTMGSPGDNNIGVWLDRENAIPEKNDGHPRNGPNGSNNGAEKTLLVHLQTSTPPIALTAVPDGAISVALNWTSAQPLPPSARIGYAIYRDGYLINPRKDTTIGATATASSYFQPNWGPENVIDRNGASTWGVTRPPEGAYEWIRLDMPENHPIERIAMQYNYYRPNDIIVEVMQNGLWVTPPIVVEDPAGSYYGTVKFRLDPPVDTKAVRLSVSAPANFDIYIPEIGLYEPWLTDQAFHDTNIQPGVHTYYVQGIDEYGNRTIASNTVEVTVGDGAPSAPRNVVATQAGGVHLTWDANTEPDLNGYIVHRDKTNVASARRGAKVLPGSCPANYALAVDGDPNTALEIGLDCPFIVEFAQVAPIDRISVNVSNIPGAMYWVKVEASVDQQRWTTLFDATNTDLVGDLALPLDPPVQIRYLRISPIFNSKSGSIIIAELEAYTPDLYPYTSGITDNVYPAYRGESSTVRSYAQIAPRRFHFASLNTPEEAPLIIEDADTNLVLASYSGSLGEFVTSPLSAKNYRFKFIGRVVGSSSAIWTDNYVESGVQVATSFDEIPQKSDTYRYGVSAIDRYGNTSAVSLAPDIAVSDNTPPAAPTGLVATSNVTSVRLLWNPVTTNDLKGYKVYRQDAATPISGLDPITDTSWVDNTVAVSGHYTYWVTAVDVNGNESERSNQVSVITTGVDLAVGESGDTPDLFVFPVHPSLLDDIKLGVSIRNLGSVPATGVVVAFYDGDPAAGGALLGTRSISEAINPDKSAAVTLPWPMQMRTVGVRKVFAVIDPQNAIDELQENNNQASISVEIVDAPPLLVQADNVDSTGFANIQAPILVQDANGHGIYGLQENHFGVKENNLAVTSFTVEALNRQEDGFPKVDIVFLMNSWCGDEGELSPDMCERAANLTSMLEQLGVDVSYTVYRGSHDGLPGTLAYCARVIPAVVVNGQIQPPMPPIAGYGVTWASMYHPWRAGASRVIITVFGSFMSTDWLPTQEIIAAARANQVTVFPFPNGYDNPDFVRVFDPILQMIAKGTGGTVYLHKNYMQAVSEIFRGIAKKAAQYIVLYSSPQPARDGTIRTVETRVHIGGTVGSDTGTYQAPLSDKPDLTFVSSIPVLYPELPTAGTTTTISATVRNNGLAVQDAVVRLYEGEPNGSFVQVGADAHTGPLPPNQVGPISLPWFAVAGQHRLWLEIDPDNIIAESREDNNKATLEIHVPGVELPDLAISSEDISVSESLPIIGNPSQLRVAVHNLGTDASGIPVGFYLGNPKSGGRLIGTTVIDDILKGEMALATVPWIVDALEGAHPIYAWVDPFGEIKEGNRENNLASLPILVADRNIRVLVTTDAQSYPMNTDARINVKLTNEGQERWSGTGRVWIADRGGQLIQDLGTFQEHDLGPSELAGWRWRIPTTIAAVSVERKNITIEKEIDFTQALTQVGLAGQELDINSIRVLEMLPDGALSHPKLFEFQQQKSYDSRAHATGKLRWIAEGNTAANQTRRYFIYFDSMDNGPKAPAEQKFIATGRDIAIHTENGTYLMESNLDGTFQPAITVTSEGTGRNWLWNIGVATADFNNDGLPDVVKSNWSSIELFLNQGDGTFSSKIVVGTAPFDYTDELNVADFNRDGNWDFLVAQRDGPQHVLYLGDGQGHFTSSALVTGGACGRWNCGITGRTVCDANEDGNPDIIIGSSNGAEPGPLYLLPGNGDGTFGAPTAIGSGCEYRRSLDCGDIDGDHHVDLVRAKRGVEWWMPPVDIMRGFGNGTFASPVVPTGAEELKFLMRVRLGDFNLDGKIELLGVKEAGSTLYYFQRGDGFDFALSQTIALAGATEPIHVGPYRPTGVLSLGSPEPTPESGRTFVWNTGHHAPGDYFARVALDEGHGAISSAEAGFAIEEAFDLALRTSTDKRSYRAMEDIEIATEITLNDSNSTLSGADVRLTVFDLTDTALWSDTQHLPDLLPGEFNSLSSHFQSGTLPAAYYRYLVEIVRGTKVFASTQGTIHISTGAEETSELVATVQVGQKELGAGSDLSVFYTAQNVGNENFENLPCRLIITNVTQEAALTESTFSLTIPIGQAVSGQQALSTTGAQPGTYLVLFQSKVGADWKTAGSDSFSIVTTDADGDGYPAGVDCDDHDPSTYPGAPEICDGKDNNCDGFIDENLGTTSCGVGRCQHTVQNCVNGLTQICDPLQGATAEICDGLDNDCDGQTDEGLGTTTCGQGRCQHTVSNCANGQIQTCDPMQGATAEVCDGVDNDCDGQADEDLGTTTCGQGLCQHTIQNCVSGHLQTCDPMQGASVEICDGKDNNCDGNIDEGLGTTTCGLGQCLHTAQNCANGQPQTCDPMAGATAEACDGKDNDCDGQADEDLGTTTCGKGVCEHTVASCMNGQPQACDPMQGASVEICDGKDNNCDGTVDEGLGSTTCGLGQCQHTVQNCINGHAQICDPMQGAATEICDGKDNNCDGRVDEDLGTTTCGQGVCAHTVDNCVYGQPQTCDPMLGSSPEVCDSKDNNCDGRVDEDLGTVTCGLGECKHTIQACVNGQAQTCDPMQGAVAELCDGKDNDCDGKVDEDLGTTTCGFGECRHTIQNCVNGQAQTCDPLQGATIEICDGKDNDCDGHIDEDLGTSNCGQGICAHTIDNCIYGLPQTCDPLQGAVVEVCDGKDNDCDGQVDESLGTTTCGQGICQHSIQNCMNGQAQTCDPMQGAAEEVCDGKDNDCDGKVDEDLGVTTCGMGICMHAVQNCLNGQTQTCDPMQGAVVEVCDGKDNDCNGQIDDIDNDHDGYSACNGDCDDNDPLVNPGMTEIPGNGKDDDCNPNTPDGQLELPSFDNAICAEMDISLLNNALIASYNPATLQAGDRAYVQGRGGLSLKNNASIAGQVEIWGNLVMDNNSYISGDARVGGTVQKKNKAYIGGQTIKLTQQPESCTAGYDLASEMLEAAQHNDNVQLSLDPNIKKYLKVDGGMVVTNNGVVVLPAGTYHLTYLELGNNAQLSLASGAHVMLFVEHRVVFSNNATVNNPAIYPERLYLLTGAQATANEQVVVRNNADLGMYLYAPYADLDLSNNGNIFGGIVGRKVTLKNNIEVFQPVIQTP